jgi:hypothetical protein
MRSDVEQRVKLHRCNAALDMPWAMIVGQVTRLEAGENARDRERDHIKPSSLSCRVRCSNPASLISIDTISISGERLLEPKLM